MVIPRSRLAFFYGVLAFLALLATWHQNLTYFGTGNPLSATVQFWKETLVTPASVSHASHRVAAYGRRP